MPSYKPKNKEELRKWIENQDWDKVENADVSHLRDLSSVFYGIRIPEDLDILKK